MQKPRDERGFWRSCEAYKSIFLRSRPDISNSNNRVPSR